MHTTQPKSVAPEAGGEARPGVSAGQSASSPDPGAGTLETLRRRLHDGLCQHLAASALLQTALADRLEAQRLAAASSEDLRALFENACRVKELLYEALDEARAVLRLLN